MGEMQLKLSPVELMEYADWISEFVKSKGFHTPCNIDDAEGMLAKLMLVVTEVSEAAEAVRKGDHENFCEELADAMIRLLDIFGAMHEAPHYWLDWKMQRNMEREQKHGKVC